MKILIVGMIESIHTARWVNQLADERFNVFLYPARFYFDRHKELAVGEVLYPYPLLHKALSFFRLSKYYLLALKVLLRVTGNTSDGLMRDGLRSAIKRINPQLIHSLETQHAGYLVLDLRSNSTSGLPLWWHTNWGSDIYLYGRFEEHKQKIKQILASCNFYSCESHRDVDLARNLGFSGKVFPVYPNTGGFDFGALQVLWSNAAPPSRRKLIMLKGYQGWAGRCLVGIRALARAKDLLSGYKVIIFSNPGTQDVVIAAKLLSLEANIEVEFLPINTPHHELLECQSKARLSIGLSISDAISTSVLEAMTMGSFPIQSDTSTANEWFIDGTGGILVPAEDPEVVEQAIRRAILDDSLVDSAAILNRDVIMDRLEYNKIKMLTTDSYNFVREQIGT